MKPFKYAAALLAASVAMPVHAEAENTVLLRQLLERMEKLEARNAELEREIRTLKAGQGGSAAEAPREDRRAVSTDRPEPELENRLAAVEKDVQRMKKPVEALEFLDDIQVEASLTGVAQRPRGLPGGTPDSGGQLNYRADLAVEVPLPPAGDIEHKVFTHLRAGQGLGVNKPLSALGYYGASPNATAFRASSVDADDSSLMLAEFWYQAAIPLTFGGSRPRSGHTLELTFGKVEVFGFFDQNAAAEDESTQFLNSAIIHNPLLDAGGEVGADSNGFQPAVIASYLNESDATQPWRLSLGVLGSGDEGASYEKSLSAPLIMLQAEKQLNLAGSLTGNYRLYSWTRNNVEEFDGRRRRHTGIGLSIDQQVADSVTLFGRYGQMIKGELPFNRALAVGAEIGGAYWGRAEDALGIGAGWLKTGSAYHKHGAAYALDENGGLSFIPGGAEKIAEIYYRYHVLPHVDLSPDFQWIKRGGGNAHAGPVKIIGLRANIAY